MRRAQLALFTLCLLLVLSGTGTGAILPALTNWGGPALLSLIQEKVNGTVTAREISGNPLTGITYRDLEITGPDGKPVFAADRLEVRLSLWSIPTFHLDLGTLVLVKPRIYLVREKSGQWNVSRLAKPAARLAEPTAPQGLAGKITAYFLRKIELSHLAVQQGELLITADDHTRRFPDLDLKAHLTLRHFGQPQQKVEADLAHLGITTPQGRAELEARLSSRAGLAHIASLNLKLAGQTVVSVQGKVCRPLAGLACTLTGQIGPLAGDKIHGFWSRWPVPWNLSGAFSLNSTPAGGKLDLRGQIGEAEYRVKGDLDATVKPAVFTLDLDLKGLTTTQLKEIQNLKAQPIQGLSPVNAHLHLKGTGLPWKPESLQTHLTLAPFRYKAVKVDKAEFDLAGNARRQDLKAAVAGNFGAVDLTAGGRLLLLGDRSQGLFGEVTVETRELQPAIVGVAQLAGSRLTTRFTGKFRLPANLSLAQAHLAGDLRARGRVQQQPLQDLTASFALDGRQLTISRAKVRLAAMEASLRGTLSEAGVDVTFIASVSGSRSLPLPPGAAFAFLRAEGAVRGAWKAPQVNLAAQVRKLSVKGVILESAHLNGALAGWPPQSGNLQLLGSQLHTPAGTFNRLHLNACGAGGRWQFQVAATSPKEPKFELAGSATLAARPLALGLTRVTWHSHGLTIKNKAPFEVHLLPGWEISVATFQVNGGTVTVAGWARDQELSGHLEVVNLNAGLLAPLGVPAAGQLNGRLVLAGNPRNPILDGQIALSGGRIKNIPLQALTTSLEYQAGQAQVSGYLEMGPLHSRLVWKGSVPVKLSLLPLSAALAQDGLNLRVQGQQINLSLLMSISPEVQSAAGPLDLLVEAQGNPHQPRISGHVKWNAGAVQLHQAGIPYRLAPGEIRLQGDKIVIPGLIIQSDGTIRLSGEIILAGTPQAQARVQAENFLLLDRGGNQLRTDGFIDLSGPLNALVANGRLMVPKAQFRPTFFRSSMDPDVILVPQKPEAQAAARTVPAIYHNLRVNVAIDSPGNAWLIDPMGKVELTAHLKARKDPGQKLVLGGQIRALHGVLDIEQKAFKVDRASLTLPGVPAKPILVDVKATHAMEDITLVLTVDGTVTNPQIHLESQPPLPPADVLSYLVFGAPAATLSKEQYFALGAQQLGVLGGISSQKLSEILGSTIPFLSGLKLKSGLVSGRPMVGVEKEVTKNVSIFAGRNFNEERGVYERQVGIEYKFNKNLSIESQVGTRNSGADVFYNYDF
jgi:autotransporter translocation and assembly factor TamB